MNISNTLGHLLYQDSVRRAIYKPTEILQTPGGKILYRDWEIFWESAETDLLGNVSWNLDETGFDLTELHTSDEWETVRGIAESIAGKLKEVNEDVANDALDTSQLSKGKK